MWQCQSVCNARTHEATRAIRSKRESIGRCVEEIGLAVPFRSIYKMWGGQPAVVHGKFSQRRNGG